MSACAGGGQKTAENATPKFTGAAGGSETDDTRSRHFHAGLIQKSMYGQIDPTVYVYAPEGDDVTQHLARIDGFKRAEKPDCLGGKSIYLWCSSIRKDVG